VLGRCSQSGGVPRLLVRRSAWLSAAGALFLAVAGCGATAAPTTIPSPSLTAAPTAPPSLTAAPTAATTSTPTPIASVDQLRRVAQLVFPLCRDSLCVEHGTKFTTCDSGLTGTSPSPGHRFSLCPFTVRLANQLNLDSQGGDSGGAPCDPVGGCQDPEWPAESITVDILPTGGVAHVVLTYGANVFKTDLAMVAAGTQGFLVGDIYCTGHNPGTTDAFTSGWDVRSVCQGS
jgi:hypothetical protein